MWLRSQKTENDGRAVVGVGRVRVRMAVRRRQQLRGQLLRRLPGVRNLESFLFLELNKEAYDFGTR